MTEFRSLPMRFLTGIAAALILMMPGQLDAKKTANYTCMSSYEVDGSKISSAGTAVGRVGPFQANSAGYMLHKAELNFDGFGTGRSLGLSKRNEFPICDALGSPDRSQCNSTPRFPGGTFVMYVHDVILTLGAVDNFKFSMDKRMFFDGDGSPHAKKENWQGSCVRSTTKLKKTKP